MNVKTKLIVAAVAGLLTAVAAEAKVTLWTCGDSSMCNYPTDGRTACGLPSSRKIIITR